LFTALEILKRENKKELFYQFAPTLLQAIPKLTFQVIINHWGGLEPSKLIPALITCDQNDTQVTLDYISVLWEIKLFEKILFGTHSFVLSMLYCNLGVEIIPNFF
jgi:hypothetical protein